MGHDSSFEERTVEFGIAPLDEISTALNDSKSYVLDVRSPEEISSKGKINHPNYRQVTCTSDGRLELEDRDLIEIVPDKDAKIVVHCAAGRRAGITKSLLESKGYTNVINGGGYDDIANLKK